MRVAKSLGGQETMTPDDYIILFSLKPTIVCEIRDMIKIS